MNSPKPASRATLAIAFDCQSALQYHPNANSESGGQTVFLRASKRTLEFARFSQGSTDPVRVYC